MRISDWSSDVCSSDLLAVHGAAEEWLARLPGAAHLQRLAPGLAFLADLHIAAALGVRQGQRDLGLAEEGDPVGTRLPFRQAELAAKVAGAEFVAHMHQGDRKSTRLNSSH